MELIAADKNTVTIKMDVQKEFLPIFAVFMAVSQEYNKLDPEIHHLSKEQVRMIEKNLHQLLQRLP